MLCTAQLEKAIRAAIADVVAQSNPDAIGGRALQQEDLQ